MVDAMKYTDHATASNKETYDKKAKKKELEEQKKKEEKDGKVKKTPSKASDNKPKTFYEEILAKEVEKDPNAVNELSKEPAKPKKIKKAP